MTDMNDSGLSSENPRDDQAPESAELQVGARHAVPFEDRDPDASIQDVLEAVERERLSMRGGLRPGDTAMGEPLVDGLESTWGRAYSATDVLPKPMLRRMLHAPEQFLDQMLSSAMRESRAVRSRLSIRDVGTVRQVGDGVASVWGLPQATTDELLLFPGNVNGLVMNLEANWIDCILLGSDETIQGGDIVWPTGRRITVPVGDRLLGRVVTALGRPIDGRGRIFINERRFIERDAPGVVERQAVNESLETGIKAIDAIVPIGRGQRELIIGDRQTGKTTIVLDTIINQRDKDVICVYVSIGQRKSTTLQVIHTLADAGAMEHTVVVMAGPDEPPAMLYLAPYVGCTIAESFLDHGHDVLIVYDDLTKHADAYRELSLLLRRPPGREAYPGDIFYLHARLLERAGRLSDARGGGSITALPIVETRRGNITAYVPTNLISITDGQIYLSPELFNQNIKPAIEAGLSVSRVGGAAQTPIMRRVSSQLKLVLAQYEEVAHFARFGAEIDRATRQQITRGLRLREVLKQPAYSPLSLPQQVLILYAVGEGYLDEVDLDQIARFEQELWEFAQREYPSVVRRITVDQEMDDDLSRDMQQLLQEFTRSFIT
jgi:F-type H+/Na+-transporting ATPase subunit alpha